MYFWEQYESIPEELGYGRFSTEHWITLLVLAALIFITVRWFRKQKEKTKERVMRVLPFGMLALEAFKNGLLIYKGSFDVGYLPLHLCSLGILVFLLYSLSRSSKWKGIFGEIAVTLILPGSIAALLFPDWAHLYPVWNFMNLYGYVWHGLLVLYPLLCLAQGQVHLSIRHIHYDFLFLLCVVPPVYLFDQAFHCNYMFVNWPPKGTPLAWIASITGEQYYLAGYAVFAAAVITAIYLGIYAVNRYSIRSGPPASRGTGRCPRP